MTTWAKRAGMYFNISFRFYILSNNKLKDNWRASPWPYNWDSTKKNLEELLAKLSSWKVRNESHLLTFNGWRFDPIRKPGSWGPATGENCGLTGNPGLERTFGNLAGDFWNLAGASESSLQLKRSCLQSIGSATQHLLSRRQIRRWATCYTQEYFCD